MSDDVRIASILGLCVFGYNLEIITNTEDIISFFVSYDYETKKNHGYGNGYVCLNKAKYVKISDIDANYLNKYMSVDITYCSNLIFDGRTYMICGFDTNHIDNNSSHDKEYVRQETIKLQKELEDFVNQ